ncbi:AAA family ATPase [Rhizobium leguminosarum]|uniref:AAA family ATPase n=1 Tax=Rhizobium leguminosarum TaxID=384 RepID=UPI003D6EAD41
MHRIAKVEVEGFWENYDLSFEVNPDVTFFIGQNGSGKTTLINLIAAVLTADFHTLNKIPFKKVTIYFDAIRRAKPVPFVSVVKKESRSRPFQTLEYRILSGESGKEQKFSIDEGDEEFLYRRYAAEVRGEEFYRRIRPGLVEELRRMFSVNWLSINRINRVVPSRDDKVFESSVDRKIESISTDLLRYFSVLSQSKDEEVRQFQESIFMSLLDRSDEYSPLDMRIITNLEAYKETIQNIFKELHVSNENTQAIINSFIERAQYLKENFQSRVMIQDAVFIAGFKKIEAIVQRWDSLQEKLGEIFSQRNKFSNMLNALLQRKTMEVAASNELQFKTRSGKILTPHMLSSGEKQLLILLSETLLQRERPTIFIADEPELSLHVLWQEKLVGNLTALNPKAQLLIATHSPDIVGSLEGNALDMETLIQ